MVFIRQIWSEVRTFNFAKILHSFLEGLRHDCLVYFVYRELKSNSKREFVPRDQVPPFTCRLLFVDFYT